MAETEFTEAEQRFTSSGDEAGTAPGDRAWRPDVEGLRAIAVGIVVAIHYGVPGFKGGYVGVDVFFVVSGFVITGLLLRENQSTGKTSLFDFYARRCRRILPAATLVILATVLMTYILVGPTSGHNVARDGSWAAAFVYNFHFLFPGWNPLSPLATYWSLAVEEQFYIVFPTLFLAIAATTKVGNLRVRLAVSLSAIIVVSYSFSIFQSAYDVGWPYLSPLTRAWELALGGLVAVSTRGLFHVPKYLAAALTWLGLAAILYSAFTFSPLTDDYPGWRVGIPVVGTALIIAGGVVVPRLGVEFLIGTAPFRWLGKRSYSMYLWHWPVLIVASEMASSIGRWGVRLLSLPLAIVLTMVTYHFLEDPVRHWKIPSKLTVQLGLGLSGQLSRSSPS